MKWYPSDWRADPALRMCSLTARGLWIELIGYMHEGEPYGYLTINGAAPSLEDISALVGRPISEVRKALAELEQRQVFSREQETVIYSRRMVRDKARAEKDRENGKGGGNPKLTSVDMGRVNPQDKAQIPESRNHKPERKDTADAVPPTASSESPYAFESGVIRLKQKDFDQWKESFSHLDLRAELLALSQWASDQGQKWFFAVSGALAKRNREVAIRIEQAKSVPAFKWNGIEGVT